MLRWHLGGACRRQLGLGQGGGARTHPWTGARRHCASCVETAWEGAEAAHKTVLVQSASLLGHLPAVLHTKLGSH
eukprot:8786666-Pyramimonas_sp.AAC.1